MDKHQIVAAIIIGVFIYTGLLLWFCKFLENCSEDYPKVGAWKW